MTSTTDKDIWFSGPVKDAISLVAEKNAVFLVYIHDDSEKTTTLNNTLKEEHVIKAIKDYTVALAMEKGSEDAALFGQYYPIQAVPILYFIKHGTIRDFGTETLSSQEIIDKINTVNQIGSTPPPVPVTESSTTTQTTDTQPDQIQAKKQELQKQLEQARKVRQEREQQEAKNREIKRRQEAKSMQEAKQNRVDKENKVYFDKLKKERQEDEAHRKRVREQIARDRAEKIAQKNAEKQRTTLPETTSGSTSINHSISNLNIRQLDGSNIRHQFQATCTLSTVRDWIQENRTDDKRRSYKLSSQFPTRLFTDADDGTTLKDLNLCPSATIIMKPLKSTSSSSLNSGSHAGMISYSFGVVYGFLFALFHMLRGFFATLFPTGAALPRQLPPVSQHRHISGGERLGGESSSSTARNSNDTPSTQKRNPYATRVNTLQEEEDLEDNDNEKRPTYNGNSVNHE